MFNIFDVQGSGEITRDNIKDAFTKFGKDIDDQELDHVMLEHDHNASNTITLDEF